MIVEALVVNIKNSAYDVLVDRTTVFGNPFPQWKWGRENCIKRYETYFYQRLERDPEFKAKVLAIRDKGKNGRVIIGCHCVPEQCHGQVIADYLDSYEWAETMRAKGAKQ